MKGIRKAAAAAVIATGGAAALALLGGAAASTASAADPIALQPQVLHAAGFGSVSGKSHIPQGNLVRSDEMPAPRSPLDTLPSAGAVDPAVQTTAGASIEPTGALGFKGLRFKDDDGTQWGAGWPPDPNGDVGPTYYVQTVNTSIGIFDKATGTRAAAYTFDSLFSANGGTGGTPCDNSNQGDPVALYDPYGGRFIVADFAWNDAQYSTGPFYQCIAVSKTSDPVTGGWYLYAWKVETGSSLPDYPKFGVWPDGL